MADKQNHVRYKMNNGKRVALCDYKGTCKNIAQKGVYPSLMDDNEKKEKGWSYLCKKHFLQEQKKYKDKLVYCSASW